MGKVTKTNFGVCEIITLTNAQIKAWADSFVTVAPLVQGRILQPYMVSFMLSPWVADYANIDGAANIYIDTPTAAFAPITLVPGAILAQGFSVCLWCDVGRELDFLPYDLNDLVSQPLRLVFDNNAAGALTGGDASTRLIIQTFYEVIPGEGAIT